jgi:hypothetical protein
MGKHFMNTIMSIRPTGSVLSFHERTPEALRTGNLLKANPLPNCLKEPF